MNIYRCILTILFLMIVTPVVSADPIRSIMVYGKAERKVVPDQLLWRITISNYSSTLESTASLHQEAIKEVLSALQELKISKKDIQTSHFSLSENFRYEKQSRIKDGFVASTYIEFLLADLKHYSKVWRKLATFESVSSNGFSYDYSKTDSLSAQLQIEATAHARTKAIKMAQALNCEIGFPIEITELIASNIRPEQPMMLRDAKARSEASHLSPGQLSFERSISVKFELLPKSVKPL